MSVIDFIEVGEHMLAITSEGTLLSWEMNCCLSTPKDECPFFRATFSYQMTKYLPLSLQKTPTQIVLMTLREVIIICLPKLQNILARHKNLTIKEDISASRLKVEDD